MTTVNLTYVPYVATSATALTQVYPTTPFTIGSYNTWVETAHLAFTPQLGEIVQVTCYVTVGISAITTTLGNDELGFYLRGRLFDSTTGLNVPGGQTVILPFHQQGTVTYGGTNLSLSINDRFVTGGLLVPGHNYVWYGEVMSEQTYGTPTMTVQVIDESIFGEVAKRAL
jgi:hypothetical protein